MRCRLSEVRIGKPYIYWERPTVGILNFPVKMHWKYPARLTWVEQSLQGFRRLVEHMPLSSIAFPLVGCHLGKLQPDDVRPLMERYLADLPCETFICLDQEEFATGIEGQMVDMLNNDGEWQRTIHLRTETIQAIRATRPIKRIRDVRKIDGIGKLGYERLHRWLYDIAVGNAPMQGALFE
jgi:hypothetical protein